ncbi:hypothetical protein QCD70_09885 [Agreia sp. PsM10]|nr:hypothetical protein [Agreia sp. PsM10]
MSLLALLAGGISAGLLYEKQRLAPDRLVADYLRLVVDGRIEEAVSLSGGVEDGLDTRLLTDETYAAASNRVSDFAIGTVEYSAGRAVGPVKIRQASTTTEQRIQLASSSKEFGLVDVWRFENVGLASVRVAVFGPDVQDMMVNGEDLGKIGPVGSTGPERQGLTLPAFPGDYEIGSTTVNVYYDVAPATASIAAITGEDAEQAGRASLHAQLNAVGEALAQNAVASYFDGCLAQGVMVPVGCTFNPSIDPGAMYSNVTWQQQALPTTRIGDWDGLGWTVDSYNDGRFTLEADASVGASTQRLTWTFTTMNVYGRVIVTDGIAVFTDYRKLN